MHQPDTQPPHQLSCPPQIQSRPCHWVEPNLEKMIPPHHEGKAERLGGSLSSLSSFMPHHIARMPEGHLTEYHKAPPLLAAVHMLTMGKSEELQWCQSQWLSPLG